MNKFVIGLVLIFAGQSFAKSLKPNAVYGTDNRLEWYQVQDAKVMAAARATFAIVEGVQMFAQPDGSFQVGHTSVAEFFQLCPEERFAQQNTLAMCSGFIIGDNIAVTAGHCLQNEFDCANLKIVFDFAVTQEGVGSPQLFAADQVYSCKKLIASELTEYLDYAVFELDRPVLGRQPLDAFNKKRPQVGLPVTLIGHPSGIPSKVAAGGVVRSNSEHFFTTNLDAYGGNSGSAVLDSKTLKVLGILVRGENDFIPSDNGPMCMVTNVCPENGCLGEEVTHIAEVLRSMGRQSSFAPQ